MKAILLSMVSMIVFSVSAFANTNSAKDHSTKEEITCGFVQEVDKGQQLVQMKPISSSGLIEQTIISRRVLPESISMAKLVKGHPRLKFCIQLPIVQGGQYKTWVTTHKVAPARLSSL